MRLKKLNSGLIVLLIVAVAGRRGLAVSGLALDQAENQPTAQVPLGAGHLRFQIEHKSMVTELAWSPDGKRVATGIKDGTIRIIDLASGKDVQSFQAGNDAGAFAFSPDGTKLAVLEGGKAVAVWVVESGKLEQKRGGALSSTNATKVAFTDDGQTIMGVGVGAIYQWKGFSSKYMPNGRPAGIAAIAPDGSVFGWCDANGRCLFSKYDSTKFEWLLTTLQIGAAQCIAFGPGGTLLVVGGDEKEVQVWDLATRKLTTKQRGLEKPATKVTFSADGKKLAALSGDSKSIRVWDLTRTSTRCQINHNRGEVSSLALAPDGTMLATIVKGGNILCVWNTSARFLKQVDRPLELGAEEMSSLWADLANKDYEKADAAWLKFGQAGDNALPFLRERIRAIAVPPVDMKRIETLIDELNAEKFATRDQASKKLLAAGELAIIPLQRVLEKPPSEESRGRANLLLKKLGEPLLTPDRLRA